MKRNLIYTFIGGILSLATFAGCSKSDSDKAGNQLPIEQLQTKSLADFVNVIALPTYKNFQTEGAKLKAAVTDLAANPSVARQKVAQDAWRAARVVWEQSEGFLIGPVDDDNYDPYMDTWPTDKNALNQLIAGNDPPTITVAYLEGETSEAELTLRGFHPLEYLLWGADGNRDPATYTEREKQYMVALATDIDNNVQRLNKSWNEDNYGDNLINPGKNGSVYDNQKDAINAIANALIDICSEVGETKMAIPFESKDPSKSESTYSHNSIADFRNNLQGALKVYTCNNGQQTGTSLSDLVAANNKSLDAQIKAQFEAAINSFDGFSGTTFENAITQQGSIIQNTLDQIDALQTTLQDKLIPYLQTYLK